MIKTRQNCSNITTYGYRRYQERMLDQSYFTNIDKHYWDDNEIMGSDYYIRKRMGMSEDEKVTPVVKIKACIKNPEICALLMMGIKLRPYQVYAIQKYYEKRYAVAAY